MGIKTLKQLREMARNIGDSSFSPLEHVGKSFGKDESYKNKHMIISKKELK